MATKWTGRPAARKLLVTAASFLVFVPQVAYGNTLCVEPPVLGQVLVRAPVATVGPLSTFSEISADAHCTNGLVSGGGIYQTLGDGTNNTAMNANGNHVNGTEPSSDGSTEFQQNNATPGAAVANDPTHWLVFGGSGGGIQNGFSSAPFAMCLTSSLINHTQIVESVLASNGLTVAQCPAGTRLLSGGARTTPASAGSMKPIASYPTYYDAAHDFGAKAAGDGNTNPDSWAVSGFFTAPPNATYAYAVCSATGINVANTTVTVRNKEDSFVANPLNSQLETVGCQSGDGQLLGGGAAITAGHVTTSDVAVGGSQGDHLTGSFPSDSAGNPVSDGTTTAAYWSALGHGGGGGPGSPTFTDTWALCATGA